MSLKIIILLLVVGFVTGFINAFAGGGSLLSLPILILLGLPASIANGTNRVSILLQSITALLGYKKSGIAPEKYDWQLSFFAAAGAIIGAYLASILNDLVFTKIIAVALPIIMVAMLFDMKKTSNTKDESNLSANKKAVTSIIFFVMGIYGGFIQAGFGLFALAVLSLYNGMPLVRANMIKMLSTLLLSVVALAIFIYHDTVNWSYALYISLGGALGGWFGSQFGIKLNEKAIKIVLLLISIGISFKLLFFHNL